jgi:phosphonate transport system substrate-binding protein
MVSAMSESPSSAPAPSFSIGRVLLIAVPVALATWGAFKLYGGSIEQEEQAAVARGRGNTLVGLIGSREEPAELAEGLRDEDGDLLADAPPADDCLDPETVTFSYVASSAAESDEATWKELLAALQEKLGRDVELRSYTDTGEQLRALKSGDLHITAFGTGEVEGAVNESGFIPVACAADQNGDYRYRMKIIVPAGSPIEKVTDLKGRSIKFVRPRSNSGCIAALVMLMEKHDLQPERDYRWGFSYGHETSIEGVAKKRPGFEAAAVASDILDRMIASGAVTEDSIRVIYESEPFPPGVIGYAYNLKPEMAAAIRETLLGFDWSGTGVAEEFGPQGAVKFAEVNYKDDWATVRDMRETGAEMIAQIGAQ